MGGVTCRRCCNGACCRHELQPAWPRPRFPVSPAPLSPGTSASVSRSRRNARPLSVSTPPSPGRRARRRTGQSSSARAATWLTYGELTAAMTSEFWINLQTRYDLDIAKRTIRRRIEREIAASCLGRDGPGLKGIGRPCTDDATGKRPAAGRGRLVAGGEGVPPLKNPSLRGFHAMRCNGAGCRPSILPGYAQQPTNL